MTRTCLLLAAALLVWASAECRADTLAAPGGPPPAAVEGTPAMVYFDAAPCAEPCQAAPHKHRIWEWLSYRPRATPRSCVCHACNPSCNPPPWAFFLDHCQGSGCAPAPVATGHAPACASCAHSPAPLPARRY